MHVTVVVIGGGHAGLAMSWRLTEGSIDHGVIEGGEVAAMIERYAATVAAPVVDHAVVDRVGRRGHGYEVATSQGTWTCDAVVVATGGAATPVVPACAHGLSTAIASVT